MQLSIYVKQGTFLYGILQILCLSPSIVSACFPVNATACLAVSEGSSDWLLAETTCSGDGGSLAVWNVTTRDFFNDLNEDVWVSNFSDSSANEFRWIDNTPFSGELLFSMLFFIHYSVLSLSVTTVSNSSPFRRCLGIDYTINGRQFFQEQCGAENYFLCELG